MAGRQANHGSEALFPAGPKLTRPCEEKNRHRRSNPNSAY
ncbi:hypothetical protein BURPS305_2923 [Burkholderia pseudomallei 305]|nr:hypothetical protein BURPS305_2923 [Burkholderia pseudomallei 305]